MKHRFLLLLALGLLLLGFTPGAKAQSDAEYIIVSGGPTLIQWEKWKPPVMQRDLWWMNFIRAARIRIQQLQEQGVPPSKITWFVYRPSYNRRAREEGKDLTSIITSVRDAYHINLKFFSKTQELIDYLNHGKPRNQVKIVNFEYFGHSNKVCFMFDYSNEIDGVSKTWLHENELVKINPTIFARNAFVKSWGCHTGESMSQRFRRTTGIPMWGAVGKSQYLTHELPTLASPTGQWRY